MKNLKKIILSFALFVPVVVFGQDKPAKWDLSSCVDYALQQNIQVKKSKVVQESGLVDTKLAKAQLFPSLSFNTTQGYVNRPSVADKGMDKNSYNGSYDLTSSQTLFDGGKRVNAIRQQQIQNRVDAYSTMRAEDDIEISITETYLQILYAIESVRVNDSTVLLSEAQRDRARILFEAGSISEADYAQFESQYSSDKYQLVVAQTSLDDMKLQLKQLLELDINDEMALVIPDLTDTDVLRSLPTKQQVYATALEVMPQILGSRLNVDIARLEVSKAKAGYLPSLNLNVGVGTGNKQGGEGFGSQLKHNLSENIGLAVSVPILNNRSTKSAVEKAKLAIVTSELDYQGEQKTLLKTIEGVYLDAVSSQTRYLAAVEQIKAVEKSFNLVEEQFFLGMKNPVDLLTEKNNLLKAKQEVLQSKYMTILNVQLLHFYQNQPIQL